MTTDRAFSSEIRRLRILLSSTWSMAWLLGIAILTVVAINLTNKLHQQNVDARLRAQAIAIYGLTWLDEQGRFHNELLKYEEDLLHSGDDVWVIEPGVPTIIHLAPENPNLQIDALESIARRVMMFDGEVAEADADAAGRPYRLLAIPTYRGVQSEPVAAIVVAADARPMMLAQKSFTKRFSFLMIALGAAGIGVGVFLANRSLRPVDDMLAQRERFLAAAAHELRTPLATLRAVCDSASAGDEPSETALRRMDPVIRRTARVVDDLLLFSRLEARSAELVRGPLRLDLLVETCIPEDGNTVLSAAACTIEADARLVTVAVRNLIENARLHGASSQPLRVSVEGATVVIEDGGPGFTATLLEVARGSFFSVHSSTGGGLGLATVKLIAQLHGGDLILENMSGGGARATLILA